MRKFKAEVSNGIGNWMGCLEQLTQLGIIVNCAMIYFTSKIYKRILVEDFHDEADFEIETGWDPLKFFTILVIIEHASLILKVAIEYFIDDVPDHIARGERDRKGMIQEYVNERNKETQADTMAGRQITEKIADAKLNIKRHLDEQEEEEKDDAYDNNNNLDSRNAHKSANRRKSLRLFN